MTYLFVYTTFPDRESAAAVSKSMVEKRLAACVNIMHGAQSFFMANEVVQEEQESIAIFKTTENQWVAIRDALQAEHPYEVPVVAAIPMSDGNAMFLKWLKEQVS